MREEAERADPVVERGDDETFFREALAVVHRNRAGAFRESAAVDIHKYRPPLARPRRRPDVQIETVFARLPVSHELMRPRLPFHDDVLNAVRPEGLGAADALPRWRGPWRPPTKWTNGRRGERNASEDGDRRVSAGHAGHDSGLRSHLAVDGSQRCDRSNPRQNDSEEPDATCHGSVV